MPFHYTGRFSVRFLLALTTDFLRFLLLIVKGTGSALELGQSRNNFAYLFSYLPVFFNCLSHPIIHLCQCRKGWASKDLTYLAVRHARIFLYNIDTDVSVIFSVI